MDKGKGCQTSRAQTRNNQNGYQDEQDNSNGYEFEIADEIPYPSTSTRSPSKNKNLISNRSECQKMSKMSRPDLHYFRKSITGKPNMLISNEPISENIEYTSDQNPAQTLPEPANNVALDKKFKMLPSENITIRQSHSKPCLPQSMVGKREAASRPQAHFLKGRTSRYDIQKGNL